MSQDKEREAFLPCPHCGEQPIDHAIEPHQHSMSFGGVKMPDHAGSHVVECSCGAGMIDETRKAVLARWNRRAALASQQAVKGEPVEWGSTKTAGQLIRQLQTFDPATPITAACHADYEGKRMALARPLVMSRERVAGRFIRQGDESVPYSLVIWSQQDEAASPPSREPLYGFSRKQLEDMRLRFAVMSDFYSKMAVELIDQVLGIHSREGGSNG